MKRRAFWGLEGTETVNKGKDYKIGFWFLETRKSGTMGRTWAIGKWLCSSSRAAITKDHRLCDLNTEIYLFIYILKFKFNYFLHSRFLLVIYFIHISAYMSIPISQFIPPPPLLPPLSPLGVHTFVLYICVSISALQIGSSVPFF